MSKTKRNLYRYLTLITTKLLVLETSVIGLRRIQLVVNFEFKLGLGQEYYDICISFCMNCSAHSTKSKTGCSISTIILLIFYNITINQLIEVLNLL